MASAVAGRAFAAARTVRPQYFRLRAQHNHRAAKNTVRSFTAGAKVWEKRYTEDHEWVEIDADGIHGTIGISSYAAQALGDVVFVELPTLDLEVSAGDSIGAVESVKSASDIMTPVSGIIVEANNVLEDKPATINKSPEGEGWLARIRLSEEGTGEVGKLKTREEYVRFTEEVGEEH